MAVVALPQSMANAVIAGVEPVYGLYSAIVLSILGSAFGNSNHLATGPTNAISLLIAGIMGVYIGKPNFYEMLFVLTFMVGAIQLTMGLLRLGKLVNYVSHSVIVGFTAGAGVIIALGQLNQLLGCCVPNCWPRLCPNSNRLPSERSWAIGPPWELSAYLCVCSRSPL